MTGLDVIAAIVAAIKAVPLINNWFSMLIAAWMNGQTTATLSAITDAAAFAARAQTDADRYTAAQKWQDALRRSRVSP